MAGNCRGDRLVSSSVQPVLPPDFPPLWAGGWGEDSRGVFAEIVVNGIPIEMRWIPPGKFPMGSPSGEDGRFDWEGPQHEVTLTRGFWLGSTPFTQAQWEAVMGKNLSQFKGGDRPVEMVNWENCQEYCEALNKLLPGLGARLPTEADWEFACRAGTSAFNDGSPCTAPEGADPALDRLGWYDKNSGGETHPVGQKQANAWGLYDMHGNVWEWCEDWFGSYPPEAQIDPAGPENGVVRVVRGGSWNNPARSCRSARRAGFDPGYRFDNLGFRLAAGQELEHEVRGPAAEVTRDAAPKGRTGHGVRSKT